MSKRERQQRWAKCQSYIKRTATLDEAKALAKMEGFRANTSVWMGAMGKLLSGDDFDNGRYSKCVPGRQRGGEAMRPKAVARPKPRPFRIERDASGAPVRLHLGSTAEQQFAWMLRTAKIRGWQCEHRFHKTRRWRFDFAWPDAMIALEIDGGGFIAGRHSTGAGIEKDCEKWNEALLLGWRILRVTPKMVRSGEALRFLIKLLEEVVPSG